MSRFLDRVRGARRALEPMTSTSRPWDRLDRPFRVLTVSNNKGGVGKSTVAANLAVYLRALREDLPILVIGLDDQSLLDRMFTLGACRPRCDVASAMRSGTFTRAIRMGQYGVQHVAASHDLDEVERHVSGLHDLREALERTAFRGLVILDTKSDLHVLTRNALAASDLVIVPVRDCASLDQAERVFALLEELGRTRHIGRVLLSLIDHRVKFQDPDRPDILALLLSEIRARELPLFESFVSTSPKVESLYTNPAGTALPVLSGARDSAVHGQLRHVADDVLKLLDPGLAAALSAPE